MRIAITSDIHHGPRLTPKAIIQSLTTRMLSQEPDVIVIGGDIGETATLFQEALGIIAQLCPPETTCAAIVGNHDLWTCGIPTSMELWEAILPNVMKMEGYCNLEQTTLIKNGVAIVGSYLHYDYSAQDTKGLAVDRINKMFPDWTLNEYYRRMKKQVNNDGLYLKELPPDEEFAALIGEEFRKRLMEAERNSSVHSTIIVTHVPCMPSQITRHPYNLGWSLGTPYFGNISHSDLILSLTKVKHVISGHSHCRNESEVVAEDGHTIYVKTIDGEYGNPSAVTVEV